MSRRSEDNFDKRVQFCEQMINIINNNNVHLNNVCFSDRFPIHSNVF